MRKLILFIIFWSIGSYIYAQVKEDDTNLVLFDGYLYGNIIEKAEAECNNIYKREGIFTFSYRFFDKNGKELLLVQYVDLYGPLKSADYYFYNNQLIYIEIKNRDNSFEKTYFNDNTLIAWYKNDKEADKTSEDFKQVEKSAIPVGEKLINLYDSK